MIGGAAGQDLVVGGGHMGVGADDEAGAAVAEMAEGHLLGGGLGMKIDQHGIAGQAQRAGFELALDDREGIVQHRLDHHAAHGLHDQHALAGGRVDQRGAAAGAALGPVHRPEQVGIALDEDQRLALVEGMVAKRHDIRARREKAEEDLLGDAEAMRGILAVHHDEVGA